MWITRCGEIVQGIPHGICPYGLALDLQSLLDTCFQSGSKMRLLYRSLVLPIMLKIGGDSRWNSHLFLPP